MATLAGFQRTSSPFPRIPVTAPPMPTARAPTGSSRNSAPSESEVVGTFGVRVPPSSVATGRTFSCAARAWGKVIKATSPARITDLEWLGFIDQHDRNAVLNSVAQSAPMAQEGIFILAILELPLAFWADQYLQQLLIQHGSPPPLYLSI